MARRRTTSPLAVAYAERLSAGDPTSERACELLLRCLRAAGEREGARRAYRAFASRLRRDLGSEPPPALAALAGS